jgi:hypothetical protein
VLHDAPGAFRGTQTPPEQYSPSVLHVPWQPSAQIGLTGSQPLGQSRLSGRGQLPEPSQKATTVARSPLHAGSTHTTPIPGYEQSVRLVPSQVPPQSVPG